MARKEVPVEEEEQHIEEVAEKEDQYPLHSPQQQQLPTPENTPSPTVDTNSVINTDINDSVANDTFISIEEEVLEDSPVPPSHPLAPYTTHSNQQQQGQQNPEP